VPRGGPAFTRLTDDSMLFVGGYGQSAASFSTAEIIRPASDLLEQAQVNRDFPTESISFTGGAPTFTLKPGALPPGVRLDPTPGALPGIRTATGTSRVVIEIVDASTPGRRALRTVAVSVTGGMVLQTRVLPKAIVGVPYTAQLLASGGGTG